MSTDKGYRIRKDAAPRELCERAAAELEQEQPQPTKESAGLLEYTPNETCREIMQYVVETHAGEISAFKPDAKPVTFNLARLRRIDWPRITGAAGALYFLVALNRLNPSTGWYTFLQQDKSEPDSKENWEAVELEPGDVFTWRGECVARPGDGEGGLMLVIKFC